MVATAIETRYAGCRFRSQTEARYAVLFDHLGIRWEYETQGYKVGRAGHETPYLPDFWLPDLFNWVEVKGEESRLDRHLLMDAMDWETSLPYMVDSAKTHGGPGLLLLGPIPRPRRSATRQLTMPTHHQLVHHKGVWHRPVAFHHLIGLTALDGFRDCALADVTGECPHELLDTKCGALPAYPQVVDAYRAARSARFEHGERG